MNIKNSTDQPLVYLNTAAAGLLSPASIAVTDAFQAAMLRNPGAAFVQWLHEGLPKLREKIAHFLGTRPSQVAFVPNFSFGLLAVMQNIQPHLKKILLYKDDYPSLNLPFELGAFSVHYIESPDGFTVPLSDIKHVIEREKIEAIAISHVQFLTGFKIDLEALGEYCQEKEVVLIVDATQSMGAVDYCYDKLKVDVLISSSYKWLNGGYGSAIICIKEEFMKRFPPQFAGFGSMTMGQEGWIYHPSVTSFEPGHQNIPGLLQLAQSIDERSLLGMAVVEQHNAHLIQRLAEGLEDAPFEACGGSETKDRAAIFCFGADKEVGDTLIQKGFSITWRKGLIRVSPHFYNQVEEIEFFLKELQGF